MERHFAETRRFFQLPQSFKEEMLVDGNSRRARPGRSHMLSDRSHPPQLQPHLRNAI